MKEFREVTKEVLDAMNAPILSVAEDGELFFGQGYFPEEEEALSLLSTFIRDEGMDIDEAIKKVYTPKDGWLDYTDLQKVTCDGWQYYILD